LCDNTGKISANTASPDVIDDSRVKIAANSMSIVTATELHARTGKSIKKAMRNPARPVIVQKRGKAAVVLVDARYFEGLVETLDILSDRSALAQLRKGIADCAAGRVISHEQLGKELGLNISAAQQRSASSRRLGKH